MSWTKDVSFWKNEMDEKITSLQAQIFELQKDEQAQDV